VLAVRGPTRGQVTRVAPATDRAAPVHALPGTGLLLLPANPNLLAIEAPAALLALALAAAQDAPAIHAMPHEMRVAGHYFPTFRW